MAAFALVSLQRAHGVLENSSDDREELADGRRAARAGDDQRAVRDT
jgi:hypothetical protein